MELVKTNIPTSTSRCVLVCVADAFVARAENTQQHNTKTFEKTDP